MNDASQLTTFLYEFYNYARHVKDDNTVVDLTEAIADLVEAIKKAKFVSLYSKKRTYSNADLGNAGLGDAGLGNTSRGQIEGSSTRAAITDALQESHFQVQYFDEEFEPLHEVNIETTVLIIELIDGCSYQLT